MDIKEFGPKDTPVILFFQGSCTHWSWYLSAIEELAKRYRVLVPVPDGYEWNDPTDFDSIDQTIDGVTSYLKSRGLRRLYALYGLSMGGSMALKMLADHEILFDKAVIDAGITPYRLPYPVTRMILLRDWLMIKIGQSGVKVLKKAYPPEKWLADRGDEDRYYKEMHRFLKGLSNETIWHTFDSTNNYAMPDKMPELPTKIEYWYGSLEGKARKWDIQYVRAKLPGVHFHKIDGMEHGQLVMTKPAEYGKRMLAFLNAGDTHQGKVM